MHFTCAYGGGEVRSGVLLVVAELWEFWGNGQLLKM